MNPGTFAGVVPPNLLNRTAWRRQLFFGASTNWFVPRTGYYTVFACGAGGSGGRANGNRAIASGGGAGGLAIKSSILLSQGTILSITCGAGGTGGTGATANGNAGGSTIVTGGGLSLFGGGGSGGIGITETLTLQAGGAGGSASGGDWNFTGGAGGSAKAADLVNSHKVGGGGGGVNFWGLGTTRGGNALNTYTSGSCATAAGGGGCGGNGGDATNSNGTQTVANGGHALSNGTSATNGVAGAIPLNLTTVPYATGYALYDWLNPNGYGGLGQQDASGSVGYAGGGGGGSIETGTGTTYSSGSTFFLGGSGGCAAFNVGMTSAAAQWGGGSGGTAGNSVIANTNGTGGNGFVVIVWEQLQ